MLFAFETRGSSRALSKTSQKAKKFVPGPSGRENRYETVIKVLEPVHGTAEFGRHVGHLVVQAYLGWVPSWRPADR